MRNNGGREPHAAHGVHGVKQVILVEHEVERLDGEANPEVKADKVENEVAVGLYPMIRLKRVFHLNPFVGVKRRGY
jgi:hypothetical protein